MQPHNGAPSTSDLELGPQRDKRRFERGSYIQLSEAFPIPVYSRGLPRAQQALGARGSLQVWSKSHLLYPYSFRTSPQICPPNYRKEGMTSWGESWAVLGQIWNNPAQKLRKHVSGVTRESQDQCIARRPSRYPTRIPLVGSLQEQIPIWVNRHQALRLFE